MTATSDDPSARRAQGQAELQRWLARSLDNRAAAARRIGAIADAERAEAEAATARARADRAADEARRLGGTATAA